MEKILSADPGEETGYMRNELFTIGPLTVYGYGFMIAVGVIAAWIITNRRAEKQKLDHEHVFSLVIWCLLGGMFCAKILFSKNEISLSSIHHKTLFMKAGRYSPAPPSYRSLRPAS